MPKKIKIKTSRSTDSVSAYLNSIEPPETRKQAKQLASLFRRVTGVKPSMWGGSMIGYGRYTYYRANGDEGEMLATGFAIRKSGPVLYIMPGYKDYSDLLEKVGPHKLGKSCLYMKSLTDINVEALETLIRRGLKDLERSHTVVIK